MLDVCQLMEKEAFAQNPIKKIRHSDAKLFLIKLQKVDGRSYSSIHSIRGVLRPAFAMAMEDDYIRKEELLKITPHVCRHTYCSRKASSGMNPKTLQYLMGHSEISVTMDTYTHLGLQDAWEELQRLQLQFSQDELGLRVVKTA